MRVRRANHCRIGLPRQVEVVAEAPASGKKTMVLLARDCVSYSGAGRAWRAHAAGPSPYFDSVMAVAGQSQTGATVGQNEACRSLSLRSKRCPHRQIDPGAD